MSADWSRQAIGWASSALLVLTLGKQVWKQWREGKAEGISSWLFVGQTAASLGFTTYSWLVKDWVFVVTNALMLCNGLLGYFILMRNRRRQERRPASVESARSSS
jgi:MtN3 and saliva related transmembrane protein